MTAKNNDKQTETNIELTKSYIWNGLSAGAISKQTQLYSDKCGEWKRFWKMFVNRNFQNSIYLSVDGEI